MVPRSKRLLYSAASTAITLGLCDLAICARYLVADLVHPHDGLAKGLPILIAKLVGGLFEVFPWVLLFCIPGWILALPITLFADVRSGFMFCAWWAAGTCAGPAVMYAVSWHYVHSLAQGQSKISWNSWFSLATAVAGLATLIYLCLLRRELQRIRSASSV